MTVLLPARDDAQRAGASLAGEAHKVAYLLGRGAYGSVFLLRSRETGATQSMKALKKSELRKPRRILRVRQECRILQRLSEEKAPFVCRLRQHFETPASFFFVMEYCCGGELFYHLSRMKRFPESAARFYAAEILCGLGAIHSLDIAYRDLKPENIMLSRDGHVRIVDFGLALDSIASMTSGIVGTCGTFEYLAPEVLRREVYGKAVDYWSLGMILHEMLTGLPPWYTTDKAELRDRILHADLTFPSKVSRKARQLIEELLRRNPEERLTGAAARDHAFFCDLDWERLAVEAVPAPFLPRCASSDAGKPPENFSSSFTRVPPARSFRRFLNDDDGALDLVHAGGIGEVGVAVADGPEAAAAQGKRRLFRGDSASTSSQSDRESATPVSLLTLPSDLWRSVGGGAGGGGAAADRRRGHATADTPPRRSRRSRAGQMLHHFQASWLSFGGAAKRAVAPSNPRLAGGTGAISTSGSDSSTPTRPRSSAPRLRLSRSLSHALGRGRSSPAAGA